MLQNVARAVVPDDEASVVVNAVSGGRGCFRSSIIIVQPQKQFGRIQIKLISLPKVGMEKEEHTYISGELLEGVKHVEAVEVNDPSCQCVIVSEGTGAKKTGRTVVSRRIACLESRTT